MFGRTFNCTTCDWFHQSEWSHTDSGQSLFCTACKTHLILGGGKSAFGPGIGETLRMRVKGDLGNWMSLEFDSSLFDDNFNVSVATLRCPACSATGRLAQFFKHGEPCPQCDNGLVQNDNSTLY